jgi:hypothetical protein
VGYAKSDDAGLGNQYEQLVEKVLKKWRSCQLDKMIYLLHSQRQIADGKHGGVTAEACMK